MGRKIGSGSLTTEEYKNKWLKGTNIGIKENYKGADIPILHYCTSEGCKAEWSVSPRTMYRRIQRCEDKMCCCDNCVIRRIKSKTNKICIGPCGENKHINEYHRNKNSLDGRDGTCKNCCKIELKEYRGKPENKKKRNSRDKLNRKNASDADKIITNARKRLYKIIKQYNITKTEHTFDIISCTDKFYAEHIISQYKPGWTYDMVENDHHIAITRFNVLDPEQLRRAFHWSNVKPMLKKDHEKKGTKLPDDYNYLYFDDDEDRWITIYWGA